MCQMPNIIEFSTNTTSAVNALRWGRWEIIKKKVRKNIILIKIVYNK